MSNTENTAAVQEAPKAETKMSRARTLLHAIIGAPIPEGSTARKEFIARAQSEIGLSKAGAITYYNNLNNELKGKPLYQYGAKKATETTAQTETEQPEEQAEDEVLAEQSDDAPVDEQEEDQEEQVEQPK